MEDTQTTRRIEALLFSDDEQRSRQLQSMFNNIGISLTLLNDKDTVAQNAREKKFDIILSDITARNPQGVVLLNLLSTDKKYDGIRVLGVSMPHLGPVVSEQFILESDLLFHHVGKNIENVTEVLTELSHGSEKLKWIEAITQQYHTLRCRFDTGITPHRAVLITGESGVCKLSLAQLAHSSGSRQSKPFLCLDCRNKFKINNYLPEGLNELFEDNIRSIMGCGQGGTLYFHHVEDLPIEMQNVLAKIILDNTFPDWPQRNQTQFNGVIMLSASPSIAEDVKRGFFSEELYRIMQPAKITIPSLGEYPEDIVPMANAFLKYVCHRMNKQICRLSTNAAKQMAKRSWPGNIKELYQIMSLTASKARNEVITPSQIVIPNFSPAHPKDDKRAMLDLIKRCKFNKAAICRELDISRPTLYVWLQKHGIPSDFMKLRRKLKQ